MAEMKIEISVTENGKKAPNWTLDTDIDGQITLAQLLNFTKNSLIAVSKEALKEEQSRGFPENPVVVVDNKHGVPLEAVSPLGKIEFFAQQSIGKILTSIYEGLLERSKVLTGAYKSHHYVTYNGNVIATNLTDLNRWISNDPEVSDKDKIRFINIQPYARKLERYSITSGKTKIKKGKLRGSGKGSTILVNKPNGTYVLTARAAKAKYGKNVFIQFEFLTGAMIGIPRYPNSSHDYLYPTILVYVFKSGIK